MKKVLKYFGGAMLLGLAAYVLYYGVAVFTAPPNGITFIEPNEKYETFAALTQHPDLKDKVLYVDFWHTGCRPCLVEFGYLPDLKANFKDDREIAFLYLGKDRSMPGEELRWKKMIRDKQVSGYHYFISDEQFYRFWDETVKDSTIVKAVPHHLIVSRKGKILNNNAPGPQHSELVPFLRAAL